jgi:hypothetical protein
MRFQIHQFDGAAGAGVFRANAFVMLGDPPFGVQRPACVEGPIGAFDDIAIAGHFPRFFFVNMLPKNLSERDGISDMSFFFKFDQSAARRSPSQR